MSAPKAQEYDSRRETNQMKYGIYFAYWEKEWNADQKKYIFKVKDLGFDILEISCAMLKNISKDELLEMKKMAEDAGVMLTAGYGPNAGENLGSSDPAVVKNAIAFYTDILKKLEILDIHTIGGGIYSYWPVDYSKPIDKEGDWARSVANVRTVGKIAGDRLGHFHVGENNRRLPGKGGMPWYQIGSALRAIGYDKNVVMEPFVRSGGGVGSDIKVWRDLSKGADEQRLDLDAAASVAYLMYSADQTQIIQVYSDKKQGLISEQMRQDDKAKKRDKERVI